MGAPLLRPPRRDGAGRVATGGHEAEVDAVELYHRTYTTVLRSTGETRLRVLEASHRAMGSSLHPLAADEDPDLGALIYAMRRVPDAVMEVDRVVMGQSAEVFVRHGIGPFEGWTELAAPGRRRRWYRDGEGDTLAVLIASASDVDDLVPTLVALQIEWNKLHTRLRAAGWSAEGPGPAALPRAPDAAGCAERLGGDPDDWRRLAELRGPSFAAWLGAVGARDMSLRIRLLGGTEVGYARVTRRWWAAVTGVLEREGLADRPIYFVSSNTHSLVNLVSGVAPRHEEELVRFLEEEGPDDLRIELRRFREGRTRGEWANLLYYAARLFYARPEVAARRRERRAEEHAAGVLHVNSSTAIDVAAQVIVLDRLDPGRVDDRLAGVDADALRRSRALVVNVDYPLGLGAYNILREIAEAAGDLRGVYVLGKAATLNADVGDVMISSVIHDEHSGSTYWLDNAFGVADIAPWLRFGSGLDNQRAVTVKSTFLQNRGYLDFYYREAFTVVEMEAGPYCNAVYEIAETGRHPAGDSVNFSKLPLDFGVIHYASDTPFTQARTLGARGLSYFGMDSTYASSVAILRRVLHLEGSLGGRS